MTQSSNPFSVQSIGPLTMVTQTFSDPTKFDAVIHDKDTLTSCIVSALCALGGAGFISENVAFDPNDLVDYRDFLLFLEEKSVINPAISGQMMANVERSIKENNTFGLEFFGRKLVNTRFFPRSVGINPLEFMAWGPEDIPPELIKRTEEIRNNASLEERLKLPEAKIMALQMLLSTYDQVYTAIHYLKKKLVQEHTLYFGSPEVDKLPGIPDRFQQFLYRDVTNLIDRITLVRKENTIVAFCYYRTIPTESDIHTQLTAFGYLAAAIATNTGATLACIYHVFQTPVTSLELFPYAQVTLDTAYLSPDKIDLKKIMNFTMVDFQEQLDLIGQNVQENL